jgi:Fe-S cluster biosynthesis and repair protein YggX
MEQMIDRMFQDMDTDHDGRISKAEWMAFQEKQFRLVNDHRLRRWL